MKKYNVEWETCFCEDYDRRGFDVVEAENIQEAIKKVQDNISHALVIRINEIK